MLPVSSIKYKHISWFLLVNSSLSLFRASSRCSQDQKMTSSQGKKTRRRACICWELICHEPGSYSRKITKEGLGLSWSLSLSLCPWIGQLTSLHDPSQKWKLIMKFISNAQ